MKPQPDYRKVKWRPGDTFSTAGIRTVENKEIDAYRPCVRCGLSFRLQQYVQMIGGNYVCSKCVGQASSTRKITKGVSR